MEKLSDPVFSKGMMGQGFAIDAKTKRLYLQSMVLFQVFFLQNMP
ncbi:PTS glucose transporter subunit IIA [Enterococcus faecium]|nr:PTS glucose transporter subunit IIA [Enterococcus faecium]